MNLLLAVKSCARDQQRQYHKAIRETWGKDVQGADLRFFMGHGAHALSPDEVALAAGDEYLELPHKTRAIFRWSLDNGYDFTFLCDTDTYVNVDRLLASGFRDYDVYGLFNGIPGKYGATEGMYAWVSGGVGYWMSRRAAEVVANVEPRHWAEDCSVCQVLGPELCEGRMTAKSDGDYGHCPDEHPYKCHVTKHYCTRGKKREFDVQWMYAHYKYFLAERHK